jgi:putative redox protein
MQYRTSVAGSAHPLLAFARRLALSDRAFPASQRAPVSAKRSAGMEPEQPKGSQIVHRPVEIEWVGGSEFEAHRAGGPKVRIDGDARAAPSPFDMLLASLATCAATDVVLILEKQRTPAKALQVTVEAQRLDATPRRLSSAVLHFTIAAPGASREKASRAVELSVTKYCSVRSSLIADASVTWTIELQS